MIGDSKARTPRCGAGSSYERELRKLLARYRRTGCELRLTRTAKCHFRIDTPNGAVFTSSSPHSEERTLHNVRMKLRHMGFEYPRH